MPTVQIDRVEAGWPTGVRIVAAQALTPSPVVLISQVVVDQQPPRVRIVSVQAEYTPRSEVLVQIVSVFGVGDGAFQGPKWGEFDGDKWVEKPLDYWSGGAWLPVGGS